MPVCPFVYFCHIISHYCSFVCPNKNATPKAIPLLRDAVATALTRRTCVHLAIPVDIQAAPSPLPLKDFCASHAELRLTQSSCALDSSLLDATAQTLVGAAGTPSPRNILAVGLRAVPTDNKAADMSKIILDLAEALNAPVLTRLHAKGVVDERHPLSFGVIGVHGKPGLRRAASLISTADCVISIGVEDETLLACNMAGLQVRMHHSWLVYELLTYITTIRTNSDPLSLWNGMHQLLADPKSGGAGTQCHARQHTIQSRTYYCRRYCNNLPRANYTRASSESNQTRTQTTPSNRQQTAPRTHDR